MVAGDASPGCPVCRHPHRPHIDPGLFYRIRSPRFVAGLYADLPRQALARHRDVCLADVGDVRGLLRHEPDGEREEAGA